MKHFYLPFFVIIVAISVNGQSCLPEGISFYSQQEIDNFKSNYPDCTEIEGSVEIEGSDITNLDSLHLITSVGGFLDIYSVPNLVSLHGLGSLESIGSGRLGISGTGLENLSGLENLVSVPGLRIEGNQFLLSFEGLSSLAEASEGVYVLENPLIEDLSGLESLVSAGPGGNIFIDKNESLSSLSGIENVVFNSLYQIEIWIRDNPMLSECDVKSICDLLDDDGVIYFSGNASGCNSMDEVKAACETSIDEMIISPVVNISPNPCRDAVSFTYQLAAPALISLQICNAFGQQVELIQTGHQEAGVHHLEWDTSALPSGIYLFTFNVDNTSTQGRIVIAR